MAATNRQREIAMQYAHIGNQVDYDQVEGIRIRNAQKQLLCWSCIWIPILLIIVIICEWGRRTGHKCGIPVQLWVELWFIVYLVFWLLFV